MAKTWAGWWNGQGDSTVENKIDKAWQDAATDRQQAKAEFRVGKEEARAEHWLRQENAKLQAQTEWAIEHYKQGGYTGKVWTAGKKSVGEAVEKIGRLPGKMATYALAAAALVGGGLAINGMLNREGNQSDGAPTSPPTDAFPNEFPTGANMPIEVPPAQFGSSMPGGLIPDPKVNVSGFMPNMSPEVLAAAERTGIR